MLGNLLDLKFQTLYPLDESDPSDRIFINTCKEYNFSYNDNSKACRILRHLYNNAAYHDKIGQIEDDIKSSFDHLKCASLIKSLRNADNVKIITEGGTGVNFHKETIRLDKEDELLMFLELYLNTLLDEQQIGSYQMLLGVKQKAGYHFINSDQEDSFYKEPYTDEELEKIINLETKNKEKLRIINGRANKHIPELGRMAYMMLNYGEDALRELTSKTKKYSFIGDLLMKALPSWKDTEWDSDSNKEKYDKVKSWVKSFRQTSNYLNTKQTMGNKL